MDILSEKDLIIQWYSGTGAGGQHRNKHQNSCRLTHAPSNTTVCAQTRSRKTSYDLAYSELARTLQTKKLQADQYAIQSEKVAQTGLGQRGSLKKRTYRFQDDLIIDHQSETKANLSQVLFGAKFELIWATQD